MSKIFISYSHNDMDTSFVNRLHQDLTKRGLDVWVDSYDIPLGASWRAAISKAIRDAPTLLVIGSPEIDKSTWVLDEISIGKRLNKPILPVIVSGGEATMTAIKNLGLENMEVLNAQQDYSATLETISQTLEKLEKTGKRSLLATGF